jgi:predicted peroxiredoxin
MQMNKIQEEFENTKGVIIIRKSKKDDVQKKKDKQRSTKHTHKTKDRVTRTPLKTGVELRCCGKVSSFCSTSGTRRVNLVTNPVISHE